MNNAGGNYPGAININPAPACAAPAPILLYPMPRPDDPIVLRVDVGAAAAPAMPVWFNVIL